jgi:hypothetical protein
MQQGSERAREIQEGGREGGRKRERETERERAREREIEREDDTWREFNLAIKSS